MKFKFYLCHLFLLKFGTCIMMNHLIADEYIEISETNLQVCTSLTNGEIMKTIGHLPIILKLACPARINYNWPPVGYLAVDVQFVLLVKSPLSPFPDAITSSSSCFCLFPSLEMRTHCSSRPCNPWLYCVFSTG